MKPRENADINPIDARVIIPTSGPCTKLFFAAPARFNPITITIVPVTSGGRSQLIQPMPADLTMRPIIAKITPVATTPPRALDIPPPVLAAAIGAKKANDEPK